MRFLGSVALSLALLAGPSSAQVTSEPVQAAGAHAAAVTTAETQAHAPESDAARADADYITPHITDSYAIDYPCLSSAHGYVCERSLPRWAPINVGGMSIDMSPTKHVVWMIISALVCLAVILTATASHARHSHAIGRPKGFAAGIESMVLYIRQEVAIPNLGHHGEKYAPFILTLFFFIMFANLLGLIPYGSTATGNISVTATLAIITFIVVEIAGMRALGAGYLNTVFYWNKDLPLYMRIPLFIIMTPIEIIGKFTKPFALTIRLFANMTAGHIVVLALIGLIFLFHNPFSAAPFFMAVLIMVLELFVALLQAFIFSLLAAVFIGQIRESAH